MPGIDDAVARALGAVPSGLFVATAGTGAAATGFLASWVQQAGFDPPCITLAVRRGRPVAERIRAGGAFCVSVLGEDDRALLAHFAPGFEAGEAAFDGIAIGLSSAGVPYVRDAAAWLGCRLLGEVAWSDHVLFAGEVVEGDRTGHRPMVHVRRTGANY